MSSVTQSPLLLSVCKLDPTQHRRGMYTVVTQHTVPTTVPLRGTSPLHNSEYLPWVGREFYGYGSL